MVPVSGRQDATRKTEQIKQMIRAMYRVPGGTERFSSRRVVHHPKNRGGDELAPTRLRELGGTLAVECYDEAEANTNGVVVQQKPESVGGTGKEFQTASALMIAAVNGDVAEFGVKNMHAILGSHSNGHLNCLSRNIEAGVRNCECIEPTVVGNKILFKCTGKARPILDEDGNYSMASLRGHDKDWHSDILQGLDWEELSWKMDDEEPDAALAISIALNKNNDAANNDDKKPDIIRLAFDCDAQKDAESAVAEQKHHGTSKNESAGYPAGDFEDFGAESSDLGAMPPISQKSVLQGKFDPTSEFSAKGAHMPNIPRVERDIMLGSHHVCRMNLEWVPGSHDRRRRDMATSNRGSGATSWSAHPASGSSAASSGSANNAWNTA